MPDSPDSKPSTWASLVASLTSWRLGSVALLSFSSGIPLGLVWIAIPTWMTTVGVDIKIVGLFSLAQAPWTFKFLWSPLMDRYPLPWLGRKRGWILASQVALLGLGLWLAGAARHPDAVWVIGALTLGTALASATQDIAYDAYTVEVLRKEEYATAVGARTALYRAAMYAAGGLAIWIASKTSWAFVNLVLALCYAPLFVVTWLAPEPEGIPEPPKSLRDAVWGPFLAFLAQHRALEILSFVVLYKLTDNLTQALLRPFLVQVGFGPFDVGIATMTLGTLGMVGGTILGGLLTAGIGLGRALWICGFLQMFSNLGYAVVAQMGVNRPVMYAAQTFEMATSGMGTGAFGVLLLRLTQKRFSATQYALLSSLMSLTRVLSGPPAGVLADIIGWRDFFVLTLLAGIPGLVMLHRFVPWRVRDPVFHVAVPTLGSPLSRRALTGWALTGALAGWGSGAVTAACLAAMRSYRAGRGFAWAGPLLTLASPHSVGEWTTTAGVLLLGVTTALATAALLVARRGIGARPAMAAIGSESKGPEERRI